MRILTAISMSAMVLPAGRVTALVKGVLGIGMMSLLSATRE